MRLFLWIGALVCLGWVGQGWLSRHQDDREHLDFSPSRTVTLTINQQSLGIFTTESQTVADFLRTQQLALSEGDRVWPLADTVLHSGMDISLERARRVEMVVDGKKDVMQTTLPTTLAILNEHGVVLDEDDLVSPAREIAVAENEVIVVTRVEIREEYKDATIHFATTVNEDDELSWRTKKVTQKGEKGVKRTTYRVSYHNGKEVNRKTLKTETIKEPVTEIVTQGTYVKLGKKHTGAASWYAWTGTMAAANPWLPKGSYVKVTNVDNGKSVIVVINDRGPFVPGRIIDLDKVAFAKIASVGAGVINVKMEEIVN